MPSSKKPSKAKPKAPKAPKSSKEKKESYGEVMRVPTPVYERVKALQARIRADGISILPVAQRPAPDAQQLTLGAVIDIALGVTEDVLKKRS